MAAYYHILTPFQISIADTPELVNAFEAHYGRDFKLKKSRRVEHFSPPLPDGRRLDFSYDEKIFALDDKVVRGEFSDFCKVFFEAWQTLYESKFKGKFPAYLPSEFGAEKIIATVQRLLNRHSLTGGKLKEELRDMYDNYFFEIERLIPQVVYQGYPLATDKHSNVMALDFLHSYEKMNIYPEEYAAMFMLVDQVKERYGDQFVLARYLFLAGY